MCVDCCRQTTGGHENGIGTGFFGCFRQKAARICERMGDCRPCAELSADGLVGASGIVAAIAILLRRKWGVLCGWICAGLTYLSILQQFIYTVVKMSGAANGDAAYQFGVVIGAFLGSGARVVLMVFYLIMLVQAGRFFAQHE